ncbi:hypothetical protein [Pengzhenrongella phosphoraccumulans]|jgi:hypothetical protein|uniref:hypothetical protein n=1 Tax=Pengzhenrongella phosphoraccumulans TaxID=3114394 RepID=UPI00388D3518
MSDISEHTQVSFEVCPKCGAMVGDLTKHDSWHSVSNSTAAEIEAGLHGAGI